MNLQELPLPTTLPEVYEEIRLLEAKLARERQVKDVIPVFRPLEQKGRHIGAWGGRGGAKSHYFAEKLIKKCAVEEHRVVCIREIQNTLAQSVKTLLEDKIKKFNYGDRFRITREAIYPSTGGIIIFVGMKQHTAQSIKSLEGFDIAWIEEAQTISKTSLELLRPTMRKDNSEIWYSWNPRYPDDPVEFLRSSNPPPGTIVVRSNFYDNPYFPSVLKRELEWDKSRDTEKYEHIWLGEFEKHSEARVFKNWKEEDFETPEGAMFFLGGDWGFSIDPSVLVRCFIEGRTLYIDYEVYMIGCEIDYLPALFDCLGQEEPFNDPRTSPGWPTLQPKGMARDWIITADSARPETISYLNRHGYPKVEAAVKGANSVKEGVIFLQGYDIVVHSRCIHTLDELRMYSYKKKPKTEEITPILEDRKNHVIDSLRYAVEKLRVETQWVTW